MVAVSTPRARNKPQTAWQAARPYLTHPLVFRLLSIVAVFAAWEYAGRRPISASFPSFSETLAAGWEMAIDGSLGAALLITIVAQAAPLSALIPLLVLAYGVGLLTKVVTVCIMAMPVIVLNSFKAIRNTPASLVEMGRSFLGSREQLIGKIILPSASPVILAGLRLGLASGFIGVVVAELLISPTGIGDLITYHQSIAEYPKMFAAIAVVILLSVLFISLLERIEVLLFRPEKRSAA